MSRPMLPPVLKWAGGKRILAPRIKEVFQVYQAAQAPQARFVDPFCGGMAVPLGVLPDRCLASDANPHLMNFYRHLRHGLEWDESTGIEFKNDRLVYYENRSKFNALCSSREYWTREGALLFYYLNRTCFNGLCRFNSNGFFNVPFGKYKKINYQTNFAEYKLVLEGWELWHGDFTGLQLNATDFIYTDPPYDVEFTQFVPKDFTWDDQVRLVKWLVSHPGPVLSSNSSTPRILELYKNAGFSISLIDAQRTISCDGDRTPAKEILAYKPTR